MRDATTEKKYSEKHKDSNWTVLVKIRHHSN